MICAQQNYIIYYLTKNGKNIRTYKNAAKKQAFVANLNCSEHPQFSATKRQIILQKHNTHHPKWRLGFSLLNLSQISGTSMSSLGLMEGHFSVAQQILPLALLTLSPVTVEKDWINTLTLEWNLTNSHLPF